MLVARALDAKEIQLKRQNRTFFQISGAGHEGAQVAAARWLRAGHDWFFPYYRDRALVLALGVSPLEMLLAAVGSSRDPASGGRQMPNHWGSPARNIVSQSSPTGTQFLQAAGVAEAARRLAHTGDEIVYCSSGEGATSEGEFWESLNIACTLKLPVLYMVQDNGYAISVPVEEQTAGGSISRLVSGFPDLLVEEIDACDVPESLGTVGRAVSWCRERRGPALVHARVVRLHSHSLSDDDTFYRVQPERDADRDRDPITRFAAWLESEGHATRAEIESFERDVAVTVNLAAEEALAAPTPTPESAVRHVYSGTFAPDAPALAVDPLRAGEPRTMVDLINACLRDELARDERVVVFGQDVADCGREASLAEVRGKGGVFKVTHGLQRRFGSKRVHNAPLAEAAIVGRAIGMSLRGLKPVVEIQFMDYIWPAFMQIRNELAALRWRSNGAFGCPLVIRVAYGGYLHGGGPYHSQSAESLLTHVPGLRVVVPSSAVDANGLLRTAIRCDDPVLFLEHKHLYRQTYNRGPYPGPDFTVPLGRASVVREGRDVTIITFGALVQRGLQAARTAAGEGLDLEIIDLRSLAPFDWQTIAASVRKTSRVVVAHEDSLSWGYGAEIAARIAQELFSELDAPVQRVAALDTFVGYHPALEDAILPQPGDILAAARRVRRY
jgi:2-oxoisovalerate dehydrogenase E1 component